MEDREEKKNGSDVFAQALRKKKEQQDSPSLEEGRKQPAQAQRQGVGFGSGVSRGSTGSGRSGLPVEQTKNREADQQKNSVKAETLDASETLSTEETNAVKDEDGLDLFEIGDMPDAVVEAGEPDVTGRAAMAAGGLLVRIFRPLGKLLGAFFAPVIKPFKKGAGKITARDWALFILLLLAVAVAVAAPSMIVRIQNTRQESSTFYTPFLTDLYYWNGGTVYSEDGVTTLTVEDGTTYDLSGLPFYYTDRNALYLPANYVWYSVDTDKSMGKLEIYTEISQLSSKESEIIFQSGDTFTRGGFVYDNSDTYILLESATLQYNGLTVSLPALSYVEVNNGTWIIIYPYGDEVTEVMLDTDAIVSFSNGASLDLTGDILYFNNGTFRLVYTYLEGIPLLSD